MNNDTMRQGYRRMKEERVGLIDKRGQTLAVLGMRYDPG
jgi:hypothetical protein